MRGPILALVEDHLPGFACSEEILNPWQKPGPTATGMFQVPWNVQSQARLHPTLTILKLLIALGEFYSVPGTNSIQAIEVILCSSKCVTHKKNKMNHHV